MVRDARKSALLTMRVYRRSKVADHPAVALEPQWWAITLQAGPRPVDPTFGLQPNRHRQSDLAAAGGFALSEVWFMCRASPSMRA